MPLYSGRSMGFSGRNLLRIVGLLILLYLAYAPYKRTVFLGAEKPQHRVARIIDGDTIEVVTAGKVLLKVRLEGIDAPEEDQSFGDVAKQRLSEMVLDKEVVLESTGKDGYGRTLANVLVDGEPVNMQLLIEGMAWHYVAYNTSRKYTEAETLARLNKVGLWQDAGPMPPWEWRRRKR